MQLEKTYNNRYRVDSLVGNGGMAIVYSGTDTLLRRRVAIKVLRDQYATDDDFVRRFSYEAQAAARLSHPNIVSVYDFGTEDGAYYIVMELVDGSTLAELLRDGGALPEPVAIDYAIQISSGLAYAHRNGLLHRDVKPANILVTHDDVVKLSDFGIARAVSEHTLGVTQPGMVMGSVAYISPEQAQGKDLDERSDLYSVGVVLYQMLSGSLPFTGENPVAVALKHVSEPAPALTGASPALAAIVARLLRKTPEERYGSATELASALREARERPHAVGGAGDPAGAPTMRFAAVAAPVPPPRPSVAPDRAGTPGYSAQAVEVHQRPPLDRRLLLIPALFVLALIVGFLALRSPVFAPPATIAVPDLAGTSSAHAQQVLANLGLQSKVSNETSDSVPNDRVLRQDPPPGTKVARDAVVALVVSGGKPRVSVPNVSGYSLPDAQRALADAKLRATVKQVFNDKVPAGQVFAVAPAVGTSLQQGSAVTLTVSRGARPATVPDVVGQSLDAARRMAARAGLTLTIGQQTENDAVPANTVASQSPDPGSTIAPGGVISVVVSTGAPAIAVPNVVGMEPQAAQGALQSAGLGVTLTYDVEPANASGKVAAQNPAAGRNAKKNSRVQIIVSVPGSVPDVTGQTLDEAKRALTASGYKIGNTVYTQQQGVAEGSVVRTEPEANAQLTPGESVNITVSGAGP